MKSNGGAAQGRFVATHFNAIQGATRITSLASDWNVANILPIVVDTTGTLSIIDGWDYTKKND
jgi:hypothetical protein